MKIEELRLAVVARTASSVKSFRRTEACIVQSQRCLEKPYGLLDRKPPMGGAPADGKATGR